MRVSGRDNMIICFSFLTEILTMQWVYSRRFTFVFSGDNWLNGSTAGSTAFLNTKPANQRQLHLGTVYSLGTVALQLFAVGAAKSFCLYSRSMVPATATVHEPGL